MAMDQTSPIATLEKATTFGGNKILTSSKEMQQEIAA